MGQTLVRILAALPPTSLFNSGEPFYLLAIPLVLTILEALIVLQLALRSFGLRLTIRKTLQPGCIFGALVFLARQLIPIPYHMFIVIGAATITVKTVGRMNLTRAVISALFSESIVIVGSIFIAEPVLMTTHQRASGPLLNTALGFSLGTILETLIPAIVLTVFVKYRLTLNGRTTIPTDTNDGRHENHQV